MSDSGFRVAACNSVAWAAEALDSAFAGRCLLCTVDLGVLAMFHC